MRSPFAIPVAVGAAPAVRLSLVLRLGFIGGFAGLIALGAHLKVGGPVPFTLQTMFVLAAGALLGPRDGLAAVLLYLGAGALRVQLFANPTPGGLTYFTGMTGGYMAGFIVAVVFVGFLARGACGRLGRAAVFGCGALLILLCGALHLCIFFHMTPWAAFMDGVLPFLAWDAVKALIATAAFEKLR